MPALDENSAENDTTSNDENVAAAATIRRDDEMEQISKYSKAMLLSSQTLDPPLVAATLVRNVSDDTNSDHSVVQAFAVLTREDDEHILVPGSTVASATIEGDGVDNDELHDIEEGSSRTMLTPSLTSLQRIESVHIDETTPSLTTIPLTPGASAPRHDDSLRVETVRMNEAGVIVSSLTSAQGYHRRIEDVRIDEASTAPNTPSEHDVTAKQPFCRTHWKLILLLTLFLLAGIVIGAYVAFTNVNSEKDESTSGNKQLSDDKNTATLDATPTISPVPTFSPSCSNTWQATKRHRFAHSDKSDNYFENGDATNLHSAVSSDGSTAVISYTKDMMREIFEPSNRADTEPYVLTMNLADASSENIQSSIQQEGRFNVVDTSLSRDGSLLLVAISDGIKKGCGSEYWYEYNNGSEDFENGGGFWIFQRVVREADNRIIWLPVYYHFTGGGQQGAVFQVATAGDIHAMVAGSYDDRVPAQIQVYRHITVDRPGGLLENTDLIPIGQRLVENTMNENTRVALAENGQRLVVYTTDGRIRIFEYHSSTWQVVAEHVVMAPLTTDYNATVAASLEVSHDGETVVLFDLARGEAHILQFNGKNEVWTMTVLSNSGMIYGSLASDGRTIVVATATAAKYSKVALIYQRIPNGEVWVEVDTVLLDELWDDDVEPLVSLTLDASGHQLVLITTNNLHLYQRICTPNGATVTPAPTATPTVQASTCVNTFSGLAEARTLTLGDSEIEVILTGGLDETDNITEGNDLEGNMTDDGLSDEGLLEVIREIIFQTLNDTGIDWFDDGADIIQILDDSDLSIFVGTDFENMTANQIMQMLYSGPNPSQYLVGDDYVQGPGTAYGRAVSGDGSIAALFGYDATTDHEYVDTYDLTNSSAPKQRLIFSKMVLAIALSGNGERLVVGTGLVFTTLEPASDGAPGSGFQIFRMEDTGQAQRRWVVETDVHIGGGPSAGVFSVSISHDGNYVALAAGAFESTFALVSVYASVEGGGFGVVGNVIQEEWISFRSHVSIAGKRIFVHDDLNEFIRVHDLIENIWTPVGRAISDHGAPVYVPLLNNAVVATFSSDRVDVYQYQSPYWLPLDTSALNGHLSDSGYSSQFTISPDGLEIMVIEVLNIGSYNATQVQYMYAAKLFRRENENEIAFEFIQDLSLQNLDGGIERTQLTSVGNFVIVAENEVVTYERPPCIA